MSMSPIKKVLIAESISNHILYSALPVDVKKFVDSCLAEMADKQTIDTDFERVLVEMNPAPDRVANHYKWRATQPVRVHLKIPSLYLEMQLVRAAYEGRNLTKVDLTDMVYHLRALCGYESLIDYVSDKGIDGLQKVIFNTYSRVSSNARIARVVDGYRRYAYNPVQKLLLEKPS